MPTLTADALTAVAFKQHARGIFRVPLAYGNTYFKIKRDTALIIATTAIIPVIINLLDLGGVR